MEWKDIEGYEGLYQVSEYGDVKSINYNRTGREQIMKQRMNDSGYCRVALTKNGTRKDYFVHRLVAEAFCDGYEEGFQVNHMDECKTNNHYSNLEWCSAQYNSNYGTRNERISKRVLCVELDMEFESTRSAAREMGYDNSNIAKCCNGKTKTYKGYHWKYI